MIVKILVVIGFCFLFWLICYANTGSDEKNMRGFRSYPKEVQELVKNDMHLVSLAPAAVNMISVFVSNVVMFSVVFCVVGIILKYTVGFSGFLDALTYFIIWGQVLNLFDLLVIDLLWWRNTPRIRFSCVQDKRLYQNPKVHVDSFVRGIVMFFIPAVIAAGIVSFI